MSKSKLLLPVLGLGFLAASSPAAVFAYATNYIQQLWKIDMQSSTSQMIGTIGFAAQGLAATSNGNLYATDPNGNLFNVTNAVVTPVAPLGSLAVGAMDSAGSTLWGYDNTSQRLFEYNPTTASFVQWSSVLGLSNIGALALNPAGDFLFVANGTNDVFGKITNGTWNVSVINPNMGTVDHCQAMDFLSDGNLYGALLGDNRWQIDPLTGVPLSGFYSGTHRDWADMTAVPAPEPFTALALCGLGLGLVRRRRAPRR